MASDVTTREITQALGRLRPKASASAIASRFQHMVSAGLFDRVGCGPLIKAVGRGRVRKYPAEALLWARVFDALLARGAGMAEVAAVAGKLGSRRSQGDPLVLGAIDRTKWVFIMYSTGANLRLAGVADEPEYTLWRLTLVEAGRDRPRLPAIGGVITAFDLTTTMHRDSWPAEDSQAAS